MADKVLSNVTSKDRPTMEQLTKVMRIGHIDIATKWREFGPVLIDSYSVISQIEADHRNDVCTCCRVMFEKWLERTPDADWDQVIAALNEINMKAAADVISRQMKSVDADNIHSEEITQFSTPDEASFEFGILLDEIVEELEKDKIKNLRKLQAIFAALTVHKNSRVRVFNDKQLEEMRACDSIRTLLIYKLRHCYRWDDFAMLTKLISSVKAKECLSMLKKFEVKINSEFKLQQIYEQCKQKALEFPTEYHKFVAIINDKIFSEITEKDYDALKHFVSEQCGVEDYVISPITKIAISSLILEWYIPATAIAHMIKIALSNKINFTKNCFVYLKISSTLILDHRDTMIEQDQLILAAKEGDVVTIEALLNDKYIDVSTIGSHRYHEMILQRNKFIVIPSKKAALHYGSKNGHVAVVEALIRAGAHVNAVDRRGKTALHYGSENGHAAVVKALIRTGADVNAVDQSSKKTALHCGSENGHVAVVEALIRAGADVNAVDCRGKTALHYGSENAVVEALTRAGADVKAVDQSVTKTKVDKIIAKPQIYHPLLSDYDTSSSRSVSSGYGTSSYDSFSHREIMILSHASECSDAKKNILRYHGELRKLPIDLIWDKLLAKKIITHEEKETIATLPLQSDRIKYFLDSIIISSLNDDKIEKFEGFLHVMKESCDPVLINFAGKLGGSK